MTETKQTNIPGRLNPWITLIGGLVGLGLSLAAALTVLSPVQPHELSVVIVEAIDISIPPTERKPLTLELNQKSLASATISRVRVVNSGKKPISIDSKPWTLTFSVDANERIDYFGEIERNPTVIEVKPNSESNPSQLQFRLGLLNPGARFEVNVVTTGARQPGHAAFVAATLVANINSPIVSRDEPKERIQSIYQDRLTKGLFALGVLGFAYPVYRGSKEDDATSLLGALLGLAALSFLGSILLGILLSRLLLPWILP